MNNFIFRSVLLAITVLLFSCQEDDNLSQTDYSIESDAYFQISSKYPNGWIKEAKRVDNLENPYEQFEYYENGYLKAAKIYSSFPQQHLYMEVSRSEDNKPLWSKYYTPEGDLWFETTYKDGLASEKKVYTGKGVSVYQYEDGDLTSVEFTRADANATSSTVYDKAEGTRTVIIKKDGATLLEEVYPYTENIGASILTNNQVPLANPFTNPEGNYSKLIESFAQDAIWQINADPIEGVPAYRNFYEFYAPNTTFATKFAVNSELYQSIIEQYPVTEDQVLTLSYQYIEGRNSFLPPYQERLSLTEEMEQDPSLFELKYGNEYVEKVSYGKILYMVGALRNMPTDYNAASEIKNAARKQMNFILYGTNELTAKEQEVLDKVWFEVKFFSTLKAHRNGIVLTNNDDYNAFAQEFQDSESSIIQLEYAAFEQLITGS
ncbi:hypothetical protein [Leeuwenhoekiella parthenopeia]|uniref:Lipoprotein n=1 Tax=Leeuwenhoekiella parthenopeia TaxID=2890320 RepID=A0ABS8GYQ3_9FLAO|nr:hypothetical protein [Leeuwenhoekiella parthenopeia]MCC4214216.1 hypothetical protein [Leeuwenhoekiella parthenopeia]